MMRANQQSPAGYSGIVFRNTQLRVAVALLVVAISSACQSREPTPEPPLAQVAVYADKGAWILSARSIVRALEEAGTSARPLRAAEIRGRVLRRYEALVIPGGNAWDQWQALGEPGLAAIADFVRGGKPYLGICAGAYLAIDEVIWEEEAPTDYPLDLLAGVARGALDEIAPWPRVSSTPLGLTAAGRARGLHWPQGSAFFYQGGPEFSELRDAEVLATYPGGAPAIVSGMYGRGRVTLTAVHFERPAKGTNDAPPPPLAGERLRALLGL